MTGRRRFRTHAAMVREMERIAGKEFLREMRQLHEQSLGPYGMEKCPDGSWTIFDRRYEPIDRLAQSAAKRLDAATRARLSWTGSDPGDRLWFYDDGCMPMSSKACKNAYDARLRLLNSLR